MDDALRDGVIDIARRAAAAILAVYDSASFEKDAAVRHKDDHSPLTAADLAAHRCIVEGLRDLTPGIPVLSEESRDADIAERRAWTRLWVVDPLDGTREFVKRNGEFTVNIALIEDHRPTVGVVYAPALDTLYSAAEGLGAWRQDAEHLLPEPIGVRVIPVVDGLPRYTIVASRRSGLDKLEPLLAKLQHYELTNVGSALKICLVAEGKADLYPRLGPTSEWDTAAAQCILEEAGGVLCDSQFCRFVYNAKDSLLNPYFYAWGGSAQLLAAALLTP